MLVPRVAGRAPKKRTDVRRLVWNALSSSDVTDAGIVREAMWLPAKAQALIEVILLGRVREAI